MPASVITQLFLPIALGLITFSLGLTLQMADFQRVVKYPKAMLFGLFIQLFVLPALGLLLAFLFQLPSDIALGLFLLACCPSGATSNFLTHLAKGETALAVTFTAVNSLITVFSIPFFLQFGGQILAGKALTVDIDALHFIQEVSAVVLIPIALGMLLKARFTHLALTLERPMKAIALGLFILIVVGAVVKERALLATSFQQVGLAALTLNILGMATGYFASSLVRLTERERVCIAIEIGVHNATLAIFIAATLLANPAMSIAPSVYGLLMFFTSAVFIFWVRRRAVDAA